MSESESIARAEEAGVSTTWAMAGAMGTGGIGIGVNGTWDGVPSALNTRSKRKGGGKQSKRVGERAYKCVCECVEGINVKAANCAHIVLVR